MQAKIKSLHVYPVKSCRGIELPEVQVLPHGFACDRQWMIVDDHGAFLTQREMPALARIGVYLNEEQLQLSVYGHGAVMVPTEARPSKAQELEVQCWDYQGPALDCGELAAEWLADLLTQPARLVRFLPNQRRWCNTQWVGTQPLGQQKEVPHTLFSDGYPILVLGSASVQDLGERMAQPVPLDRFRANLIVEGLPAYEEDFLSELSMGTEESAKLKLVKLSPRCSVPSIDQQSGEVTDVDPVSELAAYRMHQDIGGAVLGNNAVVLRNGCLRRGAVLEMQYRF